MIAVNVLSTRLDRIEQTKQTKQNNKSTSFDQLIGGVCRNDSGPFFPHLAHSCYKNLILNTENSEQCHFDPPIYVHSLSPQNGGSNTPCSTFYTFATSLWSRHRFHLSPCEDVPHSNLSTTHEPEHDVACVQLCLYKHPFWY